MKYDFAAAYPRMSFVRLASMMMPIATMPIPRFLNIPA